MLASYLPINFESNGKTFKGFCIKIQDDYHLTYAVILDGYHSFGLWLDEKKCKWKPCKFANVDRCILDHIIKSLSTN